MKPSLILHTLTLKNFATFEFQEVRFDKGFNAIIGETGSGKSLILEALQIVLGQRADKKLIRKNSDYALVEANFICTHPEVKKYFEKIGYPFDDDEISIKRMIYSSGKTKSFVNFIPCNLQIIADFSRNFIDFVGQFENQKLLEGQHQLTLLDEVCNCKEKLKVYQKDFEIYKGLCRELVTYQKSESTRHQRVDFLQYQIKELTKLNPSATDEEELIERKKLFQNEQKRLKIMTELQELITDPEGEFGPLSNLKKCLHILSKNEDLLSEDLRKKLEECYSGIEEVSFILSQEISQSSQSQDDENSAMTIEDIVERLDFYQKLKRKYGKTTEELAQLKQKMQDELDLLQNLDEKISTLTGKIKGQEIKAKLIAEEIHKIRKDKAKEISEKLTLIVRELRMKGATINIQILKKETMDTFGLSEINFMAETNPGEGLHLMADIASGGELSRILLAFRQVLSANDSISIFLFDEIDTGIGGETALKIGKALGKVAQTSQVVAITHLPQIAHYAHQLIVVSKEYSSHQGQERTKSAIKEVKGQFKKEEVSNMVPL